MASINSGTLWNTPRRIRFVVSSPNTRSTKFNQEELVGVKCNLNRGCFFSHFFTLGCLCAAQLSRRIQLVSATLEIGQRGELR